MTITSMPAVFIGHGSPMNTLQDNRFTAAWRAFGAQLPRPRAILAISAHWYINATAVTAMERPPVIHDFYGFPPELFAYDYPAPGAPDVAQEIADLVKPSHVGLDHDSWGLDHGTWSVLAHLFPRADVPVLQLSLHAEEEPGYHIELGRRLAPLRERGILVLASGNVVHNLRRMDRGAAQQGFDWALRFDEAVQAVMTSRPAELAGIASHPDYALAAPTPEHFLPLYYLAGLCDAAGEPATPFVQGPTMGSLTMTSFVLGSRAPQSGSVDSRQAMPAAVPPEQTNI